MLAQTSNPPNGENFETSRGSEEIPFEQDSRNPSVRLEEKKIQPKSLGTIKILLLTLKSTSKTFSVAFIDSSNFPEEAL